MTVICVPSAVVSTEPFGISESVMPRVSDPSRSVSVAAISNSIAESSMPSESFTTNVGSSATASTATFSMLLVVDVLSPSVVVTATLSEKSASEFSGGVIERSFN